MAAKRLTATFVRTAPPGKHYDSGGFGLILRVQRSGARRWSWRGTIRGTGRRVELGLGSVRYVTLAEAREKAFECAKLAHQGVDPRVSQSRVPTVGDLFEEVLALNRKGWRGGGTEAQWRGTMRRYVFPSIGNRHVDEVTGADVVAVLAPVVQAGQTPTARRLRQRLSAVMKLAVARGFRADDPTVAAATILPKRNGGAKHYRALPASEVAAALRKVRGSRAWLGTSEATCFLALTAARHGEVRGARWQEVDRERRVWTIAGSRAKTGRTHEIPLSEGALTVLDRVAGLSDGQPHTLVFPAPSGRPIAQTTLSKLFANLGLAGTPHGLRASFRSWAAERGVSRELAEQALGHMIGNEVEQAYQRSALLELRRELMERWSDYISEGWS